MRLKSHFLSYFITQGIYSKFIDIKFSVGCMVLSWCCLLQHGAIKGSHKTKKRPRFFLRLEAQFFLFYVIIWRILQHFSFCNSFRQSMNFQSPHPFLFIFFFYQVFIFSKCWRWNNWFRLCYGRSFYSYVKKCLHSSKISWIPIF